MIEYCTKIWGGKKISKNVFWPVYGSGEDWVRQQLNLWVNNKKPLNPEESQYAEMWLEKPGVRLYPVNEIKSKREKKKEGRVRRNPSNPPSLHSSSCSHSPSRGPQSIHSSTGVGTRVSPSS